MNKYKKVAAVVVTTVAVTGTASALANASSIKSKSVSVTTKSSFKSINDVAGAQVPGPRGQGLAKVLADLVSRGTITAAQSKAITDAIAAAEAAEAANRPAPGQGGPLGMGGFQNSNKDAIITATLGIDATTLHNRLASGESLATIAGAKKDALIAALVADESKQIDAAVAAGKLTAAQATTLKANLTAHVTAEVNETGMRMGGFGGPGHGHHGGQNGGMPGMGSNNGIPTPSGN